MIRREKGFFVADRYEKGKKCNRCGCKIFFTKSAKGKWLVLSSTGFGSESEQILEFHKCK